MDSSDKNECQLKRNIPVEKSENKKRNENKSRLEFKVIIAHGSANTRDGQSAEESEEWRGCS